MGSWGEEGYEITPPCNNLHYGIKGWSTYPFPLIPIVVTIIHILKTIIIYALYVMCVSLSIIVRYTMLFRNANALKWLLVAKESQFNARLLLNHFQQNTGPCTRVTDYSPSPPSSPSSSALDTTRPNPVPSESDMYCGPDCSPLFSCSNWRGSKTSPPRYMKGKAYNARSAAWPSYQGYIDLPMTTHSRFWSIWGKLSDLSLLPTHACLLWPKKTFSHELRALEGLTWKTAHPIITNPKMMWTTLRTGWVDVPVERLRWI